MLRIGGDRGVGVDLYRWRLQGAHNDEAYYERAGYQQGNV
jgi:hypothetical protein